MDLKCFPDLAGIGAIFLRQHFHISHMMTIVREVFVDGGEAIAVSVLLYASTQGACSLTNVVVVAVTTRHFVDYATL